MNETEKLQKAIADYRNFVLILISLNVFLCLGLVIRGPELSIVQLAAANGIFLLLIILAYIFQKSAAKCQDKLTEMDE